MKRDHRNRTEGITLIALVVTIIVLLILAGMSISMVTGNNGLFDHASTSKISAELSGYKEQLEMFKANKTIENYDFYEGSLTSGKNNLFYNTKENEEEANIKDVIPTISDEYLDIMEIIKGKLLINTQDRKLIKIANSLDIEVNPYIIIDGELMSADTNLMLVDENGTLTVPENVTRIGEGAFANVEGLKTIIIPGTVKTIGINAFRNNTTLERVIMLEGVENIENNAFNSCINLKEIVFPNSITNIDAYAMIYCSSLDNVVLPSNLIELKTGVFNSCTNLKQITLPENLERIWASALSGCINLERVTIPASVNNIDQATFGGDTKLSEINLESNTFYRYESGMLIKADGTEILFVSPSILRNCTTFTIPNGVKTFKISLNSYSNIKKIVIPKTVIEIGTSQNFSKEIEEIEVDSENEIFCTENNCLLSKDKKTLLFCYSKDKNITISNTVLTLNSFSFKGASKVESVVIPDSVKAINGQVFDSCVYLNNISIGKNVNYISAIFLYTDYRGTLTIDENNPYYKTKDGSIYSKDGKTLVTVLYKVDGKYKLDEDVEIIGNSAFHNHTKLKEIEFNNKIKEIGSSFNFCYGLERIEIPSTVEKISPTAFVNATSLREVIIHKPENSIAGSPFGNIYGLKAIKWDE
ncbi:MAG: leucine-rich repeat protein [Clostridia bacterium]|nr:leucine-rich repeat protein [Clostridia bacterium]